MRTQFNASPVKTFCGFAGGSTATQEAVIMVKLDDQLREAYAGGIKAMTRSQWALLRLLNQIAPYHDHELQAKPDTRVLILNGLVTIDANHRVYVTNAGRAAIGGEK